MVGTIEVLYVALSLSLFLIFLNLYQLPSIATVGVGFLLWPFALVWLIGALWSPFHARSLWKNGHPIRSRIVAYSTLLVLLLSVLPSLLGLLGVRQ